MQQHLWYSSKLRLVIAVLACPELGAESSPQVLASTPSPETHERFLLEAGPAPGDERFLEPLCAPGLAFALGEPLAEVDFALVVGSLMFLTGSNMPKVDTGTTSSSGVAFL